MYVNFPVIFWLYEFFFIGCSQTVHLLPLLWFRNLCFDFAVITTKNTVLTFIAILKVCQEVNQNLLDNFCTG